MDRSILNRATSASMEEVPGFYVSEIVKMSFIPPDVSIQLEDYLLKRLQREDANVKVKTLRVIRAICETGKKDFRRSLKRKADKIRACQSFNCPTHPTLGDTPRKAVREEASKCLEVLFAEEKDPNPSLAGRIEGIGGGLAGNSNNNKSNLYSSAGNFSSQGTPTSKFVGIGNTNVADLPSPQNTSAYATAGNALKYISDAAVKYLPTVKQQILRGASVFDSSFNTSSKTVYDEYTSSTGLYRSPNQAEQVVDTEKVVPATVSTRSGNEYEAKLVLDLLSPGGAKAALPYNVLQEFVKKCASLDLEVITQLIFESYNDDKATIHTKERALSIIEALLSAKEMGSNYFPVRKYVKENQLPALQADEKVAHLKGKIQDIFVLLGETVVRAPKIPPKSVDFMNDEFAVAEDGAAVLPPANNLMDDLFADNTPASSKRFEKSASDLFDIFAAEPSVIPTTAVKPGAATFSSTVLDNAFKDYNQQLGMATGAGSIEQTSLLSSGKPVSSVAPQPLLPSGKLTQSQGFPLSSFSTSKTFQSTQQTTPSVTALVTSEKDSLESFQNMLLTGDFLTPSASASNSKKPTVDAFDFVAETLSFS